MNRHALIYAGFVESIALNDVSDSLTYDLRLLNAFFYCLKNVYISRVKFYSQTSFSFKLIFKIKLIKIVYFI